MRLDELCWAHVTADVPLARMSRARTDLAILDSCLEDFRHRHGRLPSTSEGLQPLIAEGTCRVAVRDPWENPYVYQAGDAHPGTYRLKSYGGDGAPGGDGEDADIVLDNAAASPPMRAPAR